MAWLATKEAAELLGYSERAIRNKAKNGEYAYRYMLTSRGSLMPVSSCIPLTHFRSDKRLWNYPRSNSVITRYNVGIFVLV